MQRACRVLQVTERRVNRWQARRAAGALADRPAGGGAVHGLLDEEVEQVLDLAEEWGEIDRSHRKLAHRGSRLGRVWVSPASVFRVLAAHDLVLPSRRAGRRSSARPGRTGWSTGPTRCGAPDVTHFGRCLAAPARSRSSTWPGRKWLATLLSAEETSTQVEVVFTDALGAEGCRRWWPPARTAGSIWPKTTPPGRCCWQSPTTHRQMTSGSTREFLALCSIVQHFGRPHTPTDQAPIESFFGHVKGEWPHLEQIRDPDELRAEPEVVRSHYNTVRLHAGIGYLTPDDEHTGRGAQIRKARRQGLKWARRRRIAYHRKHGKETRP